MGLYLTLYPLMRGWCGPSTLASCAIPLDQDYRIYGQLRAMPGIPNWGGKPPMRPEPLPAGQGIQRPEDDFGRTYDRNDIPLRWVKASDLYASIRLPQDASEWTCAVMMFLGSLGDTPVVLWWS